MLLINRTDGQTEADGSRSEMDQGRTASPNVRTGKLVWAERGLRQSRLTDEPNGGRNLMLTFLAIVSLVSIAINIAVLVKIMRNY